MSPPLRHQTQAERIAALEITVSNLETKVSEMNGKLDQLLGLRDRGVGAFWLASALMGTGIVGGIAAFLEWWRG